MSNRHFRNSFSFLVAVVFVFVLLVAGINVHVVAAQDNSDDINVSGKWHVKGVDKFHIEFVKKGTQLIATFVYDDADLKRDYGERLPFFTATLNGRSFDGRMDYYQSKGALVTGKISKDSKTINFIDGSRSGETVLYRQ